MSQLVVQEASAGDPEAASRRLRHLKGIQLLDLTEPCFALASQLLAEGTLPAEAEEDALHISLAAVHGMDDLLTWNLRHIANAAMRSRIERGCVEAGYEAPVICTPEELMED